MTDAATGATGADAGAGATGAAAGAAGNGASAWASSIKDEGLRGTLSKFESQDKLFEAIGYKPEVKTIDWREQIKDDDAKKFAESSTDVTHLVKRALDMRTKLSNAIVRPGKNASPEEVSAYRKALGIPEKHEEYEFPEVPADKLTPEVKEARAAWSKRFHDLQIPKEVAKNLLQMVGEDSAKHLEDQVKADKAYADKSEAALRSEWKGDEFDKNKNMADRAFKELASRAGLPVDALTKLETKDGRFLMDRPELVKLFAVVGREMAEGTMGPTLTESEAETIDGQIKDIRTKQAEAQASGDSKLANTLYQKEQALIARRSGSKPIVGAQGRAA